MHAGARVYKSKQVIGQPEPFQFTPFWQQLLRETFQDGLPGEFKSRKLKAVGDLPANAFTKVSYGGTRYDKGGYVPAGVTDRLVVPAGLGGDHLVLSSWQSGAGVKLGLFVYAWLVRSDSECLDMKTLNTTASQDNTLPALVYDGELAAGDYLQTVLLCSHPLPEAALPFGTWMSISRHDAQPDPAPPGPNPNPTPNPVP